LIAVDGKEPNHGPGDALLSAVTVPRQFYPGSALVDNKTNEIPVARQLFGELDLAGRNVALDALHTQDQTARELVLEHDAHYLLTVKNNQPTMRQNIEKKVPAPPVGFSPSGHDAPPGAHRGEKQGGSRNSSTRATNSTSPPAAAARSRSSS
jgi:predicted transposase YbfD/YdcC